ncbi:MAG: bifunctional phosphopantothenoylcysteine decarboxylase/phosphopantothenate--cysteine ligase CoaBC [Myxococcales bacterium]|nr:bifunctional phosphopantothenoylcysteine decarboxylase/phosphopantothenate--cysteine ligase CoaBC [Myxococcales bacterium]
MAPTFSSTSSADSSASSLHGKTVLLGVSAGIAAYKACELARLLVKAGADVHVQMTEGATQFVQPLTFAALTSNPVGTRIFDADTEAAMPHTELGMKADLIILAPATADVIARIAAGMANDLLTTTMLVATCPVLVCPAMNRDMWSNEIVQRNISTLDEFERYTILPPDSGELACGVTGPGRLPEPENIARIAASLTQEQSLIGRRVLISGGPTREYIDPVRFLSNPATGSLAIALASCAQARGAETTLVLGPTHLKPPPGVELIRVTSAQEMCDAIMARVSDVDVLCMSAAVADYQPLSMADAKHKKTADDTSLRLTRTPDILEAVNQAQSKPIVLGFAAETETNLEALKTAGRNKMLKKNCNLLFVNHVYTDQRGFGPGDTEGILLGPGEFDLHISPQAKSSVARILCDALEQELSQSALRDKEVS